MYGGATASPAVHGTMAIGNDPWPLCTSLGSVGSCQVCLQPLVLFGWFSEVFDRNTQQSRAEQHIHSDGMYKRHWSNRGIEEGTSVYTLRQDTDRKAFIWC